MNDPLEPVAPMWCPGCGDHVVRAALRHALAELGLPGHRTLLIAGIGCSGTIQNTIAANGYHALHGRVLPTATGAKLANPELSVVGLSGDGDGFAIGAGHLVHALRRDPPITYIVMNNGTYGLTKGQPSPTSPEGYRGGTEAQFDPVLLGLASPGAGFLARGFVGRPDELKQLVVAAMRYAESGAGLAFLEVITPCVVYNDDYPAWEAKVRPVADEEGWDPTDRATAFVTVARMREEGLVPLGILFQREGAGEGDPAAVPALQPVDIATNADAYEGLVASFGVKRST